VIALPSNHRVHRRAGPRTLGKGGSCTKQQPRRPWAKAPCWQVVGVFSAATIPGSSSRPRFTRLAPLACSAMRPTPAGRPAIAIRNGPFPPVCRSSQSTRRLRFECIVRLEQVRCTWDRYRHVEREGVLVDDSGAIAAQASDASHRQPAQPGFPSRIPAWWQATVTPSGLRVARALPCGTVGLSGQMHGATAGWMTRPAPAPGHTRE